MIVVVCSALITDNNSILLVHEKKMDKYGLPGGKLEEGESLRECLIRECREELGVTIRVDDLIMITEKPKTHESNTVIRFIYKASILNESGEAELRYAFYNRDENYKLINDDLVRGKDVAKLIDDYYNGKINSITEPIVFV